MWRNAIEKKKIKLKFLYIKINHFVLTNKSNQRNMKLNNLIPHYY